VWTQELPGWYIHPKVAEVIEVINDNSYKTVMFWNSLLSWRKTERSVRSLYWFTGNETF